MTKTKVRRILELAMLRHGLRMSDKPLMSFDYAIKYLLLD